jgi:glycosyl-4,4'-diaponeurosporenoate acyltransferase
MFMQIFFLDKWLMLLLYVLVWPLFQLPIAMLGNVVRDEKFNPNSFWLKTRKWEQNGLFYKRILKIHKWKKFLPDGAKTHKGGFTKKDLKNTDSEYLKAFIAETGRAEIFHWLQILPFWVFALWGPFFVVWIMLAYALVVNLPCIIAQRYNRPRLVRLYQRQLEM